MLCDAVHAYDGRLMQVCAEHLLVGGANVVVYLQLLKGCRQVRYVRKERIQYNTSSRQCRLRTDCDQAWAAVCRNIDGGISIRRGCQASQVCQKFRHVQQLA